jgi:hypothetical protein
MEDNRKMTTSMQELVRKLIDKSISFVFCPESKTIQSSYEMKEGEMYGRHCVYTPETFLISRPTYTRYENGMLYVGWIFNDDGTVKTYD